MIKRLSFIILAVMILLTVLPLPAATSRAASNSDFIVVNGVLTWYTGTDKDVVIPGNLGIKSIATSVFSGNLNSIVIPEGVTSIAENAFNSNSTIKDITLPASLTSIGDYAFRGCGSLNNIIIPEGVTNIGVGAFEDCAELRSITLPSRLTNIAEDTFRRCVGLENITIPSSVKSIGKGAFVNCRRLSQLKLSEGLTSIGKSAFDSCNSLTKVELPVSVTSIGDSAFSWCDSLKAVYFLGNAPSMGESIFYQDYGIGLYCLNNATGYNGNWYSYNAIPLNNFNSEFLVSGETLIRYLGTDKDIVIPGNLGIKVIGRNVFFNNTNINSIKIPDGVTIISDSAFSSCQGLKSITIPSSVTSLGANAFSNCDALTEIELPASLTQIDSYAFSYCDELTDVFFYGNAPAMGSGVFDYTADDLSIYYYYNVSGFTDIWYGYETIPFMVFDSEAVSDFITRLYEKVLSRTPADSEIDYYMNHLSYEDFEDPAMTGADVGRGFVFSPEFRNRNLSNSDFIEVLYTTFMNRPSDAGGKAYWLNMLDNSVSREFVFKSFVESNEYADVCDSCGIVSGEVELPDARDQNPNLTMFVSRLYSKALGRTAETEGLNYYAAEILSGRIAPEDAAQNFIFSPEFEDKNLSDEEYVKVLYRTFMGREFDEGGLSYHLNRMGKGVSREEILFGFAYSPEFEEIMESFGL